MYNLQDKVYILDLAIHYYFIDLKWLNPKTFNL